MTHELARIAQICTDRVYSNYKKQLAFFKNLIVRIRVIREN